MQALSPFSRAARFNACTFPAEHFSHSHEVLTLWGAGLAYVDNVKAASGPLRQLLLHHLESRPHDEWCALEDRDACNTSKMSATCKFAAIPFGVPRSCVRAQCRTMSSCFYRNDLSSLFAFSFVRDPIAKFESGVRQFWKLRPPVNGTGEPFSADGVLDAQLKRVSTEAHVSDTPLAASKAPLDSSISRPEAARVSPVVAASSHASSHRVAEYDWSTALRRFTWIDEHLQPSTWRLSSWGRDGTPLLALQFIGAVETLESDLELLVQELVKWHTRRRDVGDHRGSGGGGGGALVNATRLQLARLATAIRLHQIPTHSSPADPAGSNSRLSARGVMQLCNSPLYASEWRCLGFQRPAVCLTHPTLLCCGDGEQSKHAKPK